MCKVNVVNRLSCFFCFITFFSDGIWGGFDHTGYARGSEDRRNACCIGLSVSTSVMLELGLGLCLEAMALALVLMVLVLLTSPVYVSLVQRLSRSHLDSANPRSRD